MNTVTGEETNRAFRRAVLAVICLNLGYFGIEFAVALLIRSVSLFADSVDFLEDASVNLLILVALSWSMRARARVGMMLALVLLVPALAALWFIVTKLLGTSVAAPAPVPLTLTGLGALVINFSCALLLARYRFHHGSLTRAAFLSARNDVLANVAIIVAGGVSVLWPTRWPDLIVGIGIMIMNVDAARDAWQAARSEHRQSEMPR
ncbi:cation transporter [Dyella sp. 2HG41-7]|uniref:cation transporter n=1 Tax=Dyella sp. 2HG41-7 TaxID=2883239 RepID=UPI001F28672C|nr:cation transporter [Dyella sp. 2HG41-7]